MTKARNGWNRSGLLWSERVKLVGIHKIYCFIVVEVRARVK
jgi:hypothetical protein